MHLICSEMHVADIAINRWQVVPSVPFVQSDFRHFLTANCVARPSKTVAWQHSNWAELTRECLISTGFKSFDWSSQFHVFSFWKASITFPFGSAQFPPFAVSLNVASRNHSVILVQRQAIRHGCWREKAHHQSSNTFKPSLHYVGRDSLGRQWNKDWIGQVHPCPHHGSGRTNPGTFLGFSIARGHQDSHTGMLPVIFSLHTCC